MWSFLQLAFQHDLEGLVHFVVDHFWVVTQRNLVSEDVQGMHHLDLLDAFERQVCVPSRHDMPGIHACRIRDKPAAALQMESVLLLFFFAKFICR